MLVRSSNRTNRLVQVQTTGLRLFYGNFKDMEQLENLKVLDETK